MKTLAIISIALVVTIISTFIAGVILFWLEKHNKEE